MQKLQADNRRLVLARPLAAELVDAAMELRDVADEGIRRRFCRLSISSALGREARAPGG